MTETHLRYTQNRELSWLRFNERVLLEAVDNTVPLLERLKFVSIFTSNLDEFFMIRVGSLHDMTLMGENSVDNKSGLTARQQLEAIFDAVRPLIRRKDEICASLQRELEEYGICELDINRLEKPEHKYLKHYFAQEMDPILSPQIVDSHHPFPHLVNKVLHVGALLRDKCAIFIRQIFCSAKWRRFSGATKWWKRRFSVSPATPISPPTTRPSRWMRISGPR